VVLGELGGDYMPAEAIDPGSTAVLAFTSGTTGRRKPTPLSHRNLLASIQGAMQAWRWSRHDHLVHSLPVSHQHGLSGLHATLLAGSQATLLGSFDPESTLEVVGEGATIHFGVPTIHERLLDGLGDRARLLSSLRISISGSGPLSVALFHRYREEVGVPLLERYGTTESGLDVSNPYTGPRVAGSVGIPLPGVEVAIVDESGEVAATGDSGEIVIRGPHVFSGYEDVEQWEQPFIGDWFRTGDIGAFEGSGHLRILGRAKEVIISGGMNVYPREVEDVLRNDPGVNDIAVVGVPSGRWGEEVVAFVTPSTADASALMEAAVRRLAPYKRPKRVITTDHLPRNAVGKLQTAKLIEMIPSADPDVPPDEID
jgi:malonyl-CoA/methylmalonyl-CoA synthetase